MSDRPPQEPGKMSPEGGPFEPGVMGSLPRTRPAIRSPRRDDARSSRRSSEGGPGASAEGSPRAGPDFAAGLEDLARAGISAGVGAATFGLRLAGRAASAIRDFGGAR
jgi:hypothetical protein